MKTEKIFSIKTALVALFMLFSASVMAQTNVSGNVRDEAGEPVIGATVREVGTQNATVTDFDGNYTIKVSDANATLSISYVGFQNQEIKLAGRSSVAISLVPDNETLDEVVVVGYGTMKKKLVTGATVQVKGEEIAKMNTSNALTAMQSTTPGVQITQSSSQPGKGFKVSIRGVGTIGTSSPLLIIDGVNAGTADDGLNGLNPNDIESIDVLKDAASAAIYGARAANGVILVTTKQGKAGSIQVSYDGYFGISNAYRRPSTLNAQEYMQIVNEARFNTYGTTTNWSSLVPQSILDQVNNGWEGTDWFDLYQNKNAQQTSHAVTIAGGSDRSKFSMSLNYSNQEGIMGGDNASDYSRYGARINSDHVIYRTDAGRDVVTIGENVSYWYQSSHDLAESNGYWNIMKPTYTTSPLVPLYAENGELATVNNTPGFNSQIFNNPYAGLLAGQYSSINRTRNFGVGATFYWIIEPIKGLKYRGQVNTGYSANNNRVFATPYSSSSTNSSDAYSVQMSANESSSLTMDNTLAYEFQKLGKHHLDLMVGQSFEQSNWSMGISGNASASSAAVNSLVTKGWDYAMLTNYDFAQWTGGSGYASPVQGSIASFFGRANWNYDEKYMATVTVRADGSSNFARGHRWGYFPSVSAGWDIAREAFMKGTASWLDQLKLRASWGQNGNCAIDNFYYLSNINFSPSGYADYGYKFDSTNSGTVTQNKYTTGAYSSNVPNEDVTWETSEQLNIGLDARFLNNRLGLNFDWYQKTTKDWLVEAPMNSVLGYENPAMINGGDVENKGVEVALTWNDQIGKDFKYHVGVNAAYNKNEVTRLANNSGRIGDSVTDAIFENSSYVSLVEVGHPIGYFSGMSHSGIWQNSAQIDAARAAGQAVLPGAQPGDCIWDDYNGDGVISFEEDRHEIGDPHPDVTLGFNLGFEWKGLDFSVTGSGAFGQQIMQSYRTDLLANAYGNYTRDIFNRWHGEGTSNWLPRLTVGGQNWSWVSDVYMQNADYLKIQNVTLGYDLARIWKNKLFTQVRVYAQAQNLFTFTSYTGVDPECSSNGGNGGSWVRGVDVGLYPSARTFLVGLSVKFANKSNSNKPAVVAPQTQYVEKVVEKVVEKPVVKEVVKEVGKDTGIYVVQFAVNDYSLTEDAKAELDKVNGTVEVVAYASPEGAADANQTLSENRAKAVADYLTSKGVNVRRTTGVGAPNNASNRIAIVSVK